MIPFARWLSLPATLTRSLNLYRYSFWVAAAYQYSRIFPLLYCSIGFLSYCVVVLDYSYIVLQYWILPILFCKYWVLPILLGDIGFILPSTRGQVIPVTIPRVFYVNCIEDKGPAASSMGRRVARTLPNGRASPFLYEVAMDEAKFQRNEKRARNRVIEWCSY